MRSRIINKLRARLQNLGNHDDVSNDGKHRRAAISSQPSYTTATNEYYKDLLSKNLTSFNAFALQSRSVLVRSVYARAASDGLHDMTSLQMEIDELLAQSQADETILEFGHYDLRVLLALANYLLNTSQTDLDTHAGLQILRFVLLKHGVDALSEHDKLQFVEALASLGEYDEQDRVSDLFDLRSLAPVQAELLAVDRIAHQQGAASSWVEAMNDFYVAHDMHTIDLTEDTSLPLLDRLTASVEDKVEGPLVSVIVPTFSPDRRIYTAIESLLRQTWSNLEILIVDDGSPATFDKIFAELEERDPRIQVIRQRTNGGAYTARNAGLAEARGTFITTHDDDDWSHPDKIAVQASVLMNNNSLMATTAGHIRTTSDMKFRRINARPHHLQTNYSSLMFRKVVTDRVGSWDTSKRGSDTELVERIRAYFGKSAVVNLADKPLSFSRVWDGSLTSGEIYRGYFAYSRLLYRWSFRHWHREAKKEGTKPTLKVGEPRPFATPTTFEPANRNKHLGLLDVIYVTDYNRRSKLASTVLHEIKSAVRSGLRVGFMHINSPQTLKTGDISPDLFELQLAGLVTQVGESDQADVKLLVVYDAAIGMFLDQFKARIVVQRGIVVEDGGAALRNSQRKVVSKLSAVLRHLDSSFNTSFSIIGAQRDDQERLKSLVPSGRVLRDDLIWTTHITMDKMSIRRPGTPPVIGFHSFGNKYRWPSNLRTFDAVYRSEGHSSLFYGNLAPVRRQLGDDIISEGQVIDASQTPLREFFEMIDFWVHYPHERLTDRPWPAVLEALQAGKVVILPHSLRGSYGDAAVYGAPEDVESIIVEFTNKHSRYIDQAERAQNFVEQHHSHAAYLSRLEALMEES